MIRCVVFDFDGTLVESNQIKKQTFYDLASEFENGTRLMERILRGSADRDRYWIFGEFASALSVRADAKELADSYTRICQERIARAPEIAGAKATLERLRTEGKFLFVNSATPVEPLAALVRLRQMDALFEGVYGSPAKKSENLEAIRSKHGVALDQILVVGDGESDRASAEALGCHFVAVDSAENNFAQVPPCRIPDLTGLADIVTTMGFFGDRK